MVSGQTRKYIYWYGLNFRCDAVTNIAKTPLEGPDGGPDFKRSISRHAQIWKIAQFQSSADSAAEAAIALQPIKSMSAWRFNLALHSFCGIHHLLWPGDMCVGAKN